MGRRGGEAGEGKDLRSYLSSFLENYHLNTN